ncbi:type I polyketide synthase [Renibacterium salmoninarum]|uniref:type I polyketide synthase n=1 Tax=Renibacterium salmoninarum TaxID=1646 RepID=UPI0009B5C3AE|nr:type I polyketide synthase [Renibacterium salmoninarum]
MSLAAERAGDELVNKHTQEPIAVVGMAAMFPGARNLREYRDNLFAGFDAITDAPGSRWDPALYHPEAVHESASSDRFYCRRGGFIDDFPEVSVAQFGIMPNSVEGTEPDQLIALELAAAALADAGLSGKLLDGVDRSRVGVILGRGGYISPGIARLSQRVGTAGQVVATLSQLLPELSEEVLAQVRSAFIDQLGPDRPDNAIGLVPNLAASRVANRLDLRGPAYTVDAACASSLLAVGHAVQELESRRCDMMLAGGMHHAHDATLWSVFTQLKALSAAQLSRPFDADSDGILIGEGTGVLALKRLEDAIRDGDRVYATIRGTGIASDGRTSSLMNPDPGGQSRAVRAAWNRAGSDPKAAGSVGLIEAHGTGTPAGDASELTTLREVFGPTDPDGPRAGLGSVKSMIGHAMPAAGAAGLIKAVLAVYHGVLPPTLGVSQPHPALSDTRFAPVSQAAEWTPDARQPLRRAGVNAFGFGGINAHIVVEQVSGQAAVPVSINGTLFDVDQQSVASQSVSKAERLPIYPPEPGAAPVLLLAAASQEELQLILAETDDQLLARVGSAPGTGSVRLGIVSPGAKQFSIARKAVARGKAWHGRSDVWFRPEPLLDADGGGLAFVCPGLEVEFSPRIDDVLSYFDLPRIRGIAAGSEFTENINLQGSAVLQVSRTLSAALAKLGVQADAFAGHSLGEWSAMMLGDMFDSEEVDAFLDESGMAEAQFSGLAFAVIGAPASMVLTELAGREDVVLSHDNAPQQSMICGPGDVVDELVELFRGRGYVSKTLPFTSGFHTPMFAKYLDQLEILTGSLAITSARTPVWSATTTQPFPADHDEIQEIFVRHLLEHVRFRELIENMSGSGIRFFVQLGPGQLGSLISDTLHSTEHVVVSANNANRSGLDQLRTVLTALWAAGRNVDLDFLGQKVLQLDATANTAKSLTPNLAAVTDAEVAHAVAGPRSKLDLSSPVIVLTQEAAQRLGKSLHSASVNTAAAGGATELSAAALAPGSNLAPTVAAELKAFLGETDAFVASVLSGSLVGNSDHVVPTAPTPPVPNEPTVPPSMPEIATQFLDVSLASMPHLADHSFFTQRADWPDFTDRFPVVPGTTMIRLMMDSAEQSTGRHAVAVHSVRFHRWADLFEPTVIEVSAKWIDENRLAVSFGNFSHCTVELASEYGTAESPLWSIEPTEVKDMILEEDISEFYRQRWMFHGPQYQGLTAVHGRSETHIRGTVLAKPAKGSLMDNVGQLAGYWLMSEFTERATVYPAGIQTLRFYGPDPAPGESVECHMRITEVNDSMFQTDGQLVHNGKLWCEVTGWQDRRFDSAPNIREVEAAVEHHAFAQAEPGGWVMVPDYWPDLASRDLTMRRYLAKAERLEHQASAPLGRRQRLLGRLAAKDAVRLHVWESDPDRPLFPAEVGIGHLCSGQPTVSGMHGTELPELDISIAHSRDIGVAIASPRKAGSVGVGIDIESIEELPDSVENIAFTAREQQLLDQHRANTEAGSFEYRSWFTRFWSAKEAVGKALGTGLAGKPRQFEVRTVRSGSAESDYIFDVNDGQNRIFEVSIKTIQNPEKLPDHRYVVAWTTGPADLERNPS